MWLVSYAMPTHDASEAQRAPLMADSPDRHGHRRQGRIPRTQPNAEPEEVIEGPKS